MREKDPELHRQRVSQSLIGNKRRWKGDEASYFAKHIWIHKYFGKADHCDHCHTKEASRYEWAHKEHGESRDINDYIQLCPSCHRIFDQQNKCRKGHLYTPETTYINCRGHRRCLICKAEREAKNAKDN